MDILSRIKELRKDRNWSEYNLAEKSELPQSTISSWYKKEMLPSYSSLEKICKGFGITLSQFFASQNDLVDLTIEQREMLERWNILTSIQKSTLLAFLKTI